MPRKPTPVRPAPARPTFGAGMFPKLATRPGAANAMRKPTPTRSTRGGK